MTARRFLSPEILRRVRTVFDDLPERSRLPRVACPENPDLRSFLEASGTEVALEAGEILFQQDERGDGIYRIESGLVAVLQGRSDEPRLLGFCRPGEVVGEIAMLDQVPRTATIAAIAGTRLRHLSDDKFQGLLAFIPGVGVEMMRLLSARLRAVSPADYSAGLYDHLTGALSRQTLDIRLQEEMERARLYQYGLSLVFLDIDRFKLINDTRGHGCGDAVLVAFVERVKANLRTTDLLFRFGGDEFVLILQGVDPSRGPALAHHLVDDVGAMEIQGDPPLRITCSAGVAYYPLDGDTPETLLHAADRRLYQSKRAGRARVTCNEDA